MDILTRPFRRIWVILEGIRLITGERETATCKFAGLTQIPFLSISDASFVSFLPQDRRCLIKAKTGSRLKG